jgi:hypothetical protein
MITKKNLKSSKDLLVFLLMITIMLWAEIILAEPKVSTDKNAYEPNEKIRVHFLGAPGSNRDWITIVPDKAKDNTVGDYDYIPYGQSKGVLTFKAPSAPGEYEVRAYYNYREKGYVVSARHDFFVSRKPSHKPLLKHSKKKKSSPQLSSPTASPQTPEFGPR